MTARDDCPMCYGTREIETYPKGGCKTCHGQRWIAPDGERFSCPDCNGTGDGFEVKPCPECSPDGDA